MRGTHAVRGVAASPIRDVVSLRRAEDEQTESVEAFSSKSLAPITDEEGFLVRFGRSSQSENVAKVSPAI